MAVNAPPTPMLLLRLVRVSPWIFRLPPVVMLEAALAAVTSNLSRWTICQTWFCLGPSQSPGTQATSLIEAV
ncbi:hypothetical protein D3C84_1294810 [compost metagenome]